jgi:hypothetical protein
MDAWHRSYPAGIWAVDFEFTALPGERQQPVCMVAHELHSGHTIRLWEDQFGDAPPFPIGPDALFVAYYASAELGCFRTLGWPMPARILDLYAEFRDRTSGLPRPCGAGLLGALAYFGLGDRGATEKHELQQAIGDGTWRGRFEQAEVLDYCAGDVLDLERLLRAMAPRIDLPRALLRGRYMGAAAAIEFNGSPIDVPTLEPLREHWTGIQDQLIVEIDRDYGVFDGRTFKADRWVRWLTDHGIPWPRLESGQLALDDDTFRHMARAHPEVAPMRELRHALSSLRLADLAVGRDGRNRTLLGAFGSRTGRNQPSNSKFIFGPSVWLRGLIKPPPGMGLAYIDWAGQEFGIGAALSGDGNMLAAYLSGQPYIEFGKQIGALPADATKRSHPAAQNLYKICCLGILYDMGEQTLASHIGGSLQEARGLLRAHHQTYPKFWEYSDAAVAYAMLNGSLHTRYGWHVHTTRNTNPRTLRNFPLQANAAEMMRLAAISATEGGIEVCAVVHDAFLICAPLDRLEEDIARMRAAMARASHLVLDGFEIRTDVHRVPDPRRLKYIDRYMDDRGKVMWERVMQLLARCQAGKAAA